MAVPIRERSQFKVGKYDVIAQPVQGSAQMLRYTVMLGGKRLGALLSVPTESDCKFIESPPPVPPLKIFYVTSRPGRPKKGTPPRTNVDPLPPPREELPHGMDFPQAADEH